MTLAAAARSESPAKSVCRTWPLKSLVRNEASSSVQFYRRRVDSMGFGFGLWVLADECEHPAKSVHSQDLSVKLSLRV